MFASSVATLAIGYVASVIVARVLGRYDRGLLAALQVDATMAMNVLGVGMHVSVLYYASRRRRYQAPLVGIVLVHAALLTVASIVLVLAFGPTLAAWQDASYDQTLWLLAALLVPAGYLELCFVNFVQAQQDFRRSNILIMAGRTASLVGAVTLVWWLGYGVTGAVISALGISLVQIAGSLRPVLRDGIGFSRRLVRVSLSYGLRIQVAALFRMAAGRFDLLLLSLLVPLSTVGYYAIAQIVSELVLLMPRAFGTVLVPVLAGDSRDARLSAPAVRLSGTLSLAAVAGVAVLGPLLIQFGYGPEYTAAIVPLLILLPGIWFQSAGDLSSYVLAGRGRPGTSSVLAAVQGIATVALDLVLIPPYGAVGAAIASLLAYTVYGLVSLWVLGGVSGEPVRSMLVLNRSELDQVVGRLRQLAGRGTPDGGNEG